MGSEEESGVAHSTAMRPGFSRVEEEPARQQLPSEVTGGRGIEGAHGMALRHTHILSGVWHEDTVGIHTRISTRTNKPTKTVSRYQITEREARESLKEHAKECAYIYSHHYEGVVSVEFVHRLISRIFTTKAEAKTRRLVMGESTGSPDQYKKGEKQEP